MPRLGDDMDTHNVGGGKFNFTGARIQNLGATEYTLATIAVDKTGSLQGHEAELREMLVTAVRACQKSPRSDNLLLRVIAFNSSGIEEVHGFKPLADINPDNDYVARRCYGGTPLYDAAYSAVGATNVYAEKLYDQDFLANAVSFVATDGEDNCSVATPSMIADEIEKAVKGEHIESHHVVLIGLTSSPQSAVALQRFKDEAHLTQYIDAGDVTRGKLARLAAFVSNSISSTSQALGTGGPSQNIAAAI